MLDPPALASSWLIATLLILAAVTAVLQIEGNVLHPIIVDHTLPSHSLAIAYALTADALLSGIGGAFLAVPGAAVGKAIVHPSPRY